MLQQRLVPEFRQSKLHDIDPARPLAYAHGAEPHDQVPVEAAEWHTHRFYNPSAERSADSRQYVP
jgi:hypothetical protein